MALFEPLFDALNQAEVRYVVVGGLAVVLHGYARMTADVDLVVDLDPREAAKAIDSLVALGLRPRVPVDASAFADSVAREAWIRDRGMQVFSMYDPTNPMRVVDLFVEYPIAFASLWEQAETVLIGQTKIRFASIDHLIEMKRKAGRPQDRVDLEQLESIRAGRGRSGQA